MSFLEHLPKDIAQFIRLHYVAEYASVSSAGVPIDTPILIYLAGDGSTLDLGTGLAYPLKAERARKNPKVGLLFEAGPDKPVVSIGGMAAVRDSDLQANMNRYLEEEILVHIFDPKNVDYQNITRKAVWYFTRILVNVMPAHIRWWDNPAAMDKAPQEWRAPANTVFPTSDPTPPGKISEAAKWEQPTWQELQSRALERKALGHLTLCDAGGFPLPFQALDIKGSKDGFTMRVPKSVPWRSGKSTLSFEGREMFVGDANVDNSGNATIKVERALPILPLTADPVQVLQPNPDTQASLMKRLEHEAARRGQKIPTMPAQPPEPTANAKIRAAAGKVYEDAHPDTQIV